MIKKKLEFLKPEYNEQEKHLCYECEKIIENMKNKYSEFENQINNGVLLKYPCYSNQERELLKKYQIQQNEMRKKLIKYQSLQKKSWLISKK